MLLFYLILKFTASNIFTSGLFIHPFFYFHCSKCLTDLDLNTPSDPDDPVRFIGLNEKTKRLYKEIEYDNYVNEVVKILQQCNS